MKKKLVSALMATTMIAMMAGCGSSTASTSTEAAPAETAVATEEVAAPAVEEVATASGLITVLTREDGSGTRGAFTEITGVHDGDNDNTTVEASVQNSTGKVMTAVAADPQAIGYISLGSLDDTVKAVTVEGIEATPENILDGSYLVARPFNIATLTGADLSPVAVELLEFVFTQEMQDVAEEEGFIPVPVTTDSFESAQPSGTITVGGSTSVYPLMEVMVEAYLELNPNATINIEGVGSSSGMNGAADGTFDIGMASREMKDSEKEVLTGYVLAQDGIAVVVNNENPLENVTIEQIKAIYTGEVTDYSELY
ncbi:substrate-binding domain-containing protein [Chakrabartyella piscis]|uniref:substrate-binding domain-containing protein n=1 Tax=Chakrabartyella piscis TaxID=2918914 RepID=UPI00295883BE|nr:substrate-binding domain-containing protein [Chakrabartyella piscis]